jgi:hypothetical protein
MDPALNPLYFEIDWAQLGEALGALLFLSFAVERALSVLFESRLYDRLHGLGAKSLVAAAVSFVICWSAHFDVIGIAFHQERVTILGSAVTALVVAGGSKGVMTFMRQVLKIPNYKDQLEGRSTTHLSRDFRREAAPLPKPGGQP